jgi:hypothetical protein
MYEMQGPHVAQPLPLTCRLLDCHPLQLSRPLNLLASTRSGRPSLAATLRVASQVARRLGGERISTAFAAYCARGLCQPFQDSFSVHKKSPVIPRGDPLSTNYPQECAQAGGSVRAPMSPDVATRAPEVPPDTLGPLTR